MTAVNPGRAQAPDPAPSGRRPSWPDTAVAAGGLVTAVGAAAYVSAHVLLAGMSGREAVGSPLCVTANLVMTAGLVTLVLGLPSFGARSGLPRVAVAVAVAACVFAAANAWSMGTELAGLTGLVTDAQWEAMDNPMVLLSRVPKMVLGLVGFGALAVAGWRRRAFSRGACVLLALGAVVGLLPPHQPGALVAGVALGWAALTVRR
ncbi:hypothetical protein GCM10009613_28440 [Pseudonocardia kongjuensis]|uniref:DUF1275 domain-containing protein n=1 Tax=Pseudonocardia kongjuensis TaxID=102227 RepID=A0ABN1XTF0_9PSEU